MANINSAVAHHMINYANIEFVNDSCIVEINPIYFFIPNRSERSKVRVSFYQSVRAQSVAELQFPEPPEAAPPDSLAMAASPDPVVYNRQARYFSKILFLFCIGFRLRVNAYLDLSFRRTGSPGWPICFFFFCYQDSGLKFSESVSREFLRCR